MAVTLDKYRVSEHEFTREDVGGYCFNEEKCTSSSDVAYKFRVSCWFNEFKEAERKVKTAFYSTIYSDAYSAFSGYNVNTKIFVDDEQKAAKTITSISKGGSAPAASWEGYLDYDEDGNLEFTVKATLACSSNDVYPPKSAEVTIDVKFPQIESLSKKSFKVRVNGKWVDAIAYAYHDNGWVEAEIYVRDNNEWKEGA